MVILELSAVYVIICPLYTSLYKYSLQFDPKKKKKKLNCLPIPQFIPNTKDAKAKDIGALNQTEKTHYSRSNRIKFLLQENLSHSVTCWSYSKVSEGYTEDPCFYVFPLLLFVNIVTYVRNFIKLPLPTFWISCSSNLFYLLMMLLAPWMQWPRPPSTFWNSFFGVTLRFDNKVYMDME